jgi:hypothetical protein
LRPQPSQQRDYLLTRAGSDYDRGKDRFSCHEPRL